MPRPRIAALIVAGGNSQRFGGDVKQYSLLNGTPVLERTTRAFHAHPEIHAVQVVIRPQDVERYQALPSSQARKVLPYALGGRRRQDSVINGLMSLQATSPEFVLIHDGARPLISAAFIERLVRTSSQHDAVIPVLKISDAVKYIPHPEKAINVHNTDLYRAQTPQRFCFQKLSALLSQWIEQDIADESMLFEKSCRPIHTIAGDPLNLKITYPEDLIFAASLLKGE